MLYPDCICPGDRVRRLAMCLFGLLASSILVSGCNPAVEPATPARPAWFSINLTDVRTGATFSMNDFTGRVVLIETIAEWCPNCLFQQHQTRTLRNNLGNPADLVLISLDVDSHEDEPSLKEYTEQFGFDWYFAVAPLELQRALGNLYSAEYLNPPLEPMLMLNREGAVYTLTYGEKSADDLKQIVLPHLTPQLP
jgi:hypothetical protein